MPAVKGASPTQFGNGKLNIWAMLRSLVFNDVGFYVFNGPPVNGTSGTFAKRAGLGAVIIDNNTGNWYVNTGTRLSPIWSGMGSPVSGLGGLGVTSNAKFTYDFAVDGGAVSTITPSNSPIIPAKAIILGGVIDITTTLTSGASATIALGLGSGAQVAVLKAATAVATWAAGLTVPIIPVFTAASYYKATAAAQMTLTVATAALTAGKMDVSVVYVMGN